MKLTAALLAPALFLAALTIQPLGAAAARLEAKAAIVAVTVFPDRAKITRALEVTLPAGETTLAVGDLPASLQVDSLRVEGAGVGGLQIGSVEARPVFSENLVRDAERRLRQELLDLRDLLRAQDDAVAAARLQLEFIAALGREVPKSESQDIARGEVDPERWRAAWGAIGQGAAGAFGQIRQAETEKRGLQAKIQQKERELGQIRTGRRASIEALVKLTAPNEGKARIEISYQLGGASWRPLYDARLETESGALELVQIGEVRQNTGEDWTDIELTLSTARPGQGAQPPRIDTWFVNFLQPRVALEGFSEQSKGELELRTLTDALSADTAAPAAEPPSLAAAAPVTAQVVAGGFAARYRIPGESSVTADSAPQKFVMTQRDLTADLRIRAVPKVRPEAFLLGEVTYEGEEPLLPGPLAIFRDGAFVGRSQLALARPGETFELAFGADDRVRVDYRLVKGERSEEGIINKDQRFERRYRIEVTNHHDRAIAVTILDQIPVPRDERIEVKLLRNMTNPKESDFEGRPGVVAWVSDYEPQEKKTINFGYEITFPEGKMVPGF